MTHVDSVDRGHQHFYTLPPDSRPPVKRDDGLDTFILERLEEAGEAMRTTHLRKFEDTYREDRDYRKDQDLMRPFQEAQIRAEQMKNQGNSQAAEELKLVTTHVHEVYEAYRKFWAVSLNSKSHKKSQDSLKSAESPTTEFARQFTEGPPTFIIGDVRAIKASYAYTKCSAPFAFTVAYHDLCAFKATALGDVPTSRLIAETMDIRSSFLRVLDRSSGD
jgi:RNA-dependent RNA polymerase